MAAPDKNGPQGPPPAEEPPPFLGRWRNVYLLLLAELAVLTIAFYALTRWAS